MHSTIWTLANLSVLFSTHLGIATAQVAPSIRGTPVVVANVTDPTRSRDSCGSVKIGNRALWVCRDTTGYHDGAAQGPLVPNSASWTDFDGSGNPLIIHNASVGAGSNGTNPVLLMYGGSYNETTTLPFYPLDSNECPSNGFCPNGTARFAVWPNQPPMVASTASDGTVTAYSWISQNLITRNGSLDQLYPDQPYSLYRFTYTPPAASSADPDAPAAPQPTLVNASFWGQDEWGYGAHGTLVANATAYLYAQNDARTAVALAKVPLTAIEDRSQYLYYVNSKWVSTMPSLTDSDAFLPQLGTTWQGTFWYSQAFQTYLWIGEDPAVSSSNTTINFVMSSANDPEGPWLTPYYLNFSQPRGDEGAGAYSIQAHPELVAHPATNRSLYVSYTFHQSGYTTPLIYMQLE